MGRGSNSLQASNWSPPLPAKRYRGSDRRDNDEGDRSAPAIRSRTVAGSDSALAGKRSGEAFSKRQRDARSTLRLPCSQHKPGSTAGLSANRINSAKERDDAHASKNEKDS